MLTQKTYINLKSHLQSIAENIPIRWGRIQNDRSDQQINMFTYNNFTSLNEAIKHLNIDSQNYFKKRWFLWQCAQCDEYLFYKHKDVKANPNPKDQNWDIELFNNPTLRFDIKGTITPRTIRESMQGLFPDPMDMIQFFYNKQSSGVRSHTQNRIFIIHSGDLARKENIVRANFDAKEKIYSTYLDELRIKENPTFFTYKNVLSDLIYIRSHQDNSITHHFASSILS